MALITSLDDPLVVERIKAGQVVVLPTDTLYGLVASATNNAAINEVYRLKKRDEDKALIVLAASVEQIEQFHGLNQIDIARAAIYWPAPLTVLIRCDKEALGWLQRGTGAVGFRIPADEALRRLLQKTRPIVAPSANLQGDPPATNVQTATKHFGESVTCYVDGGERSAPASTIIRFDDAGNFTVTRAGAYTPLASAATMGL